ncbi:hypothetical protein L0Z11_04805 [Burkholderia multivorans]|uniref:hypothetical protein n=1 Tax=Burkholderia multivorans TaxID=87883 RepID=UPI001CC296ED|nr:hypothetical protein [Burkholderia multivorans]UQN70222.1 hypothetical protein L0Z45_04825 [Burkholderia multivorans]UQN75952.1 hypothetical protein L0Z11_04805 [Burkholderia multivorans]
MNNMQTTTSRNQAAARSALGNGFIRAMIHGIYAGIAAGFIVLVPVLILQLARGIGVVPEMQLAASSVMGMAAYAGVTGLILGTLLHFSVSVASALAYALFVWAEPALNRWAWIGGPVLGLIVFFFMDFAVLPRSAFTTPPSVTPMPFIPAILVHMFGLGLSIALIMRKKASQVA